MVHRMAYVLGAAGIFVNIWKKPIQPALGGTPAQGFFFKKKVGAWALKRSIYRGKFHVKKKHHNTPQ